MNRRVTIVTEGEADRLLIGALLDVPDKHVNIVVAHGWSAADSVARSLLVRDNADVALVVDADTSDSVFARERERFLKRSLGEIASSSRWQVFVFVPTIEVLFFDHPAVLRELVGHDLTDQDIIRGRFEPKRTLEELLPKKSIINTYRENLTTLDLSELRRAPKIEELRRFLESASKEEAA